MKTLLQNITFISVLAGAILSGCTPDKVNIEPEVSPRIFIGVGFDTNPQEALIVHRVVENSPASESGLLAGDVIIRVGGQAVSNLAEFGQIIAKMTIGAAVQLDVFRGNSELSISVIPSRLTFANQDIHTDPVFDKVCNNQCECKKFTIRTACSVHYLFIGISNNGGVIYQIFCITTDTAAKLIRKSSCGPFEFF